MKHKANFCEKHKVIVVCSCFVCGSCNDNVVCIQAQTQTAESTTLDEVRLQWSDAHSDTMYVCLCVSKTHNCVCTGVASELGRNFEAFQQDSCDGWPAHELDRCFHHCWTVRCFPTWRWQAICAVIMRLHNWNNTVLYVWVRFCTCSCLVLGRISDVKPFFECAHHNSIGPTQSPYTCVCVKVLAHVIYSNSKGFGEKQFFLRNGTSKTVGQSLTVIQKAVKSWSGR